MCSKHEFLPCFTSFYATPLGPMLAHAGAGPRWLMLAYVDPCWPHAGPFGPAWARMDKLVCRSFGPERDIIPTTLFGTVPYILYFRCLDLYFGCLDLYLGVWTCILGVWTCILCVWTCIWVSGLVFGCLCTCRM